MRYSLLKSFDKIYILDLHGNVRKKEITPDGGHDENVFDIMQGVSINIFVKNVKNSNNNVASAHCVQTAEERKGLRLKPAFSEPLVIKNDSQKRIENFTPKFREFINKKYGEIKPEEILGYIYAVLFHKEYRKKYFDFLKIDFPKIPFVESKEDFLKFAKLGEELYNLHLGNSKIQKEVGFD